MKNGILFQFQSAFVLLLKLGKFWKLLRPWLARTQHAVGYAWMIHGLESALFGFHCIPLSCPSGPAWPPACALCLSLMFPAFYTCFAHTHSGISQTVNVCRADREVQAPNAGRLCRSCGLVSGKQIPSPVGAHFIFPLSSPPVSELALGFSALFFRSSSSDPPGSATPLPLQSELTSGCFHFCSHCDTLF